MKHYKLNSFCVYINYFRMENCDLLFGKRLDYINKEKCRRPTIFQPAEFLYTY